MKLITEYTETDVQCIVEKKEDGYFELSKKGEYLTRQSADPVFELNASFYFYRKFMPSKSFRYPF